MSKIKFKLCGQDRLDKQTNKTKYVIINMLPSLKKPSA